MRVFEPVEPAETRKTLQTPTLTRRNPYPWCGYGFAGVGVRVALENPRVTRDNH